MANILRSVRCSTVVFGIALLLVLASLASPPPADAVLTDVFSGITCCAGSGAPYSGFVGTLDTPGITFGTDTGFAWHPFGLGDFGSISHGTLSAPVDGVYPITLESDDGSLLFVDGALKIDNGGPHGPGGPTVPVFLTAGLHPFEVEFFECCGGPSGLDLTLPTGLTFGPNVLPSPGVPMPAALVLLGSGLIALALHRGLTT